MNDLCKQLCNCKWHVNAYNVKYVGTDKPLGYCACAKVMKTIVTYAYNRYTHKDAVQMCHNRNFAHPQRYAGDTKHFSVLYKSTLA